MGRKKAKKNFELDEEEIKKVYVEKNFIRPTEKELETINECENEENSCDISQGNLALTEEKHLDHYHNAGAGAIGGRNSKVCAYLRFRWFIMDKLLYLT